MKCFIGKEDVVSLSFDNGTLDESIKSEVEENAEEIAELWIDTISKCGIYWDEYWECLSLSVDIVLNTLKGE